MENPMVATNKTGNVKGSRTTTLDMVEEIRKGIWEERTRS